MHIDFLVNNAGYGVPGGYASTTWADQRAFLEVMVVAVAEKIDPDPGFRWLSVTELHRMLEVDDMVNMDTRSVLA